MIPIRDTTPCRNYPVVNTAIIAVNVLVYLFQMGMGDGLERFFYIYGFVPARYTVSNVAAYFSAGQQLFSLVSFMFLHGGFFHLLGNMWSLYIFGDNIEDRLGPFRYLLFYVLCGMCSGLSHFLFHSGSNMPVIGASGAIAGVMGAYFILYPTARVLTLIPIFIFPWFVEIPAFVFLGLWFVMQFVSAAGSLGYAASIAWWAHVGGFVFGIIILKGLLALPSRGITRHVRRFTEKKKTSRLQVIRPGGRNNDPNLYGTMTISGYEALTGTIKLVNIPRGFRKRLFRVTVPPGIAQGTILRLRGLGKQMPEGIRGDLMLKVLLEE